MQPDEPIAYIQRTRAYYEGLGYSAPYRWAKFDEVPFSPLAKPLGECKVALVTTAVPYRPEFGEQGPGAPYNGSAKFFDVYKSPTAGDPDVRISHIAYDRRHTSAQDKNTWFPLEELKRAQASGRIDAVSENFFGLPTNRSHNITQTVDCPRLLELVLADGADCAIIVPNCPVCHQSAAFAARHLEVNGIPAVVMGCAKDIAERAGVARFLFSDFPLGNSAGKPHDLPSQAKTLELALNLLEEAAAPRTTWNSPIKWSKDSGWKQDYCNIELLSVDEISRRRAEFDAQKRAAKFEKA
ncbi:MAG: glycine reductase [Hyphomicrobiales bacterium]